MGDISFTFVFFPQMVSFDHLPKCTSLNARSIDRTKKVQKNRMTHYFSAFFSYLWAIMAHRKNNLAALFSMLLLFIDLF
ncbi:hypothetical protein EBI00_00260 [Marinomonas hwangdonensis]|uniref:Uncharacterized protein n=1 Tax=Marinomonas hwangdonensis TaxID=1053647 RepID=A0A3M8QA61_9GAMM|nr:hypothetical protein EBI00_00260 [Marinomonas hwangdonensis]